jgi:hypothetical protein
MKKNTSMVAPAKSGQKSMWLIPAYLEKKSCNSTTALNQETDHSYHLV